MTQQQLLQTIRVMSAYSSGALWVWMTAWNSSHICRTGEVFRLYEFACALSCFLIGWRRDCSKGIGMAFRRCGFACGPGTEQKRVQALLLKRRQEVLPSHTFKPIRDMVVIRANIFLQIVVVSHCQLIVPPEMFRVLPPFRVFSNCYAEHTWVLLRAMLSTSRKKMSLVSIHLEFRRGSIDYVARITAL